MTHPGICNFKLSKDVLGHVVLSHGIHHKVLVPCWALCRPILVTLLLREDGTEASVISGYFVKRMSAFWLLKCIIHLKKSYVRWDTAWRSWDITHITIIFFLTVVLALSVLHIQLIIFMAHRVFVFTDEPKTTYLTLFLVPNIKVVVVVAVVLS